MKKGSSAVDNTVVTSTTDKNIAINCLHRGGQTSIGYMPIEDGLVVEHIKMDKTANGVYLPQSAQERNNVIKVLAISDEVYKRTPIRIGSLIYLATSRPLPVLELASGEYLQARISDVLGIVHE